MCIWASPTITRLSSQLRSPDTAIMQNSEVENWSKELSLWKSKPSWLFKQKNKTPNQNPQRHQKKPPTPPPTPQNNKPKPTTTNPQHQQTKPTKPEVMGDMTWLLEWTNLRMVKVRKKGLQRRVSVLEIFPSWKTKTHLPVNNWNKILLLKV